jgi:hypothetical protein
MSGSARVGMKREHFVLVLLALYFLAIIVCLNRPGSELQAYRQTGLPFGCVPSPNRGYAVQDFALNLLYLRGIEERVVAHPYRQEEQERLMHHWLPTASSGMCHAYSPVAFVLALPLLALEPDQAYIAYSFIGAVSVLLLCHFYLFPAARTPFQLYLLIVCLVNLTWILAFAVGQSALITTPLLGTFWLLVQRRAAVAFARADVPLALLFWALCLKPSIAMIPLCLLLGARAWAALGLGAGLLAATWAFLGDRYGGWCSGLRDYADLLNHYYEGAMIPFMRDVFTRHGDTGANAYFATLFPGHSAFFFSLSHALFLGVSAGLLVLRWTGRLTASAQFQGMIWNFLLFCPYLLPSEDCIFCLLIVEGAFYRDGSLLEKALKLALVLALMNLRAGLTFPGQINFPLKCVLLAWILVEALRAHDRVAGPSPFGFAQGQDEVSRRVDARD